MEKTNAEKRRIMDKAFGCEFIIQEKHKNFLNLFPPFKETLEKYEGEELWYVDSGNDYRTSWGIAKRKDNCTSMLCSSYDCSTISDKIEELFPKTEAEKAWDEELDNRRIDAEIKASNYKKKMKKQFKVTKNSEDIFRFGKYEGETVYSVIKNDPSYITWCLKNKYQFPKYLKDLEAKYNVKIPINTKLV